MLYFPRMVSVPRSLWLALAVAACGSRPQARAPAPPPTTTAGLGGHWVAEDGNATETWVAIDGVDVGVGFATRDGATTWYEVMLVTDDALTAMPGGGSQVAFPRTGELAFANPAHDDPTEIRYHRAGDRLHVTLNGADGRRELELRAAAPTPAPELVGADAAFDRDSAERAGAAWAERLEPDGATWPVGSERRAGPDAVAASIDGLRARGLVLRWVPSTSGLSAAADAGFTAGSYRILDATGATVGTGVYVTIWRRAADGTWKIAFDTGIAR